MRNCLLLASSAAALMLAIAPAYAQTSSGNLSLGRETSARFPAEGTDYRLQIRPGQRVEIVFRSDDVDAYLELFAEGDLQNAVAQDDDGLGEGTNSRIRYASADGGNYVVRLAALGFDEAGSGRVIAREIAPAVQPRAGRIAVGDSISGNLSSNSGEADDGARYDLYTIRLDNGQRIAITQSSEDFDSVVAIGRTSNGVFEELARNDDGVDIGLDSYLVFTAPRAGEYSIRAQGLGRDSRGEYQLSVEEGPAKPRPEPINPGDRISGTISTDSPRTSGGGYGQFYSFSGVAGQPVSIDLSSDDFDTYLEVLDGSDTVLAEDDDSGGDLNSSLIFTPSANGTYVIVARPFSSGTGDFDLAIESISPPPPPMALRIGDKVEGELDDNSAAAGGQKRYDAYRIQLAEDQRIQVTLRSGDFDTVVQIGRDGESFEELASDDDGLGQGTDSRLLYTAPEGGSYIIRATSYDADGRGDYELEVKDRGPEPHAGSILIGSTVRSALSEQDNTSDSGSYYKDYVFTAKANDRLRFTMVAPAFDTVVVLGEMRNDDFRQLESDDDGLSDTHSRLHWTAPRAGEYVIRATSYAPNSTGDFILTAEYQP